MNRVVTASVVSVIILIAALAGFLYLRNMEQAKDKTFEAIPADAACIVRGHLTATEIKPLLSSAFIKNFNTLQAVQTLETRLSNLLKLQNANADVLGFFQKNMLTVSIHPTKVDAYDFIFYADNAGFAGADFITQKVTALYDTVINQNIRTYVGEQVYDLQLKNGGIFTYTLIGDLLIASTTSFLVEDAMRQFKAGKAITNTESFSKLSADNSEGLSVYINYGNLPKWFGVFCNSALNIDFNNIKHFAQWSKLDLTINQNHISCSGYTLADTGSFMQTLMGQNAKAVKVFEVMPDNVALLKSYMLSNVSLHFDKLNNYLTSTNQQLAVKNKTIETLQGLIVDEYGLMITEPASTNIDNNVFAYFLTNNAKASLKLIGATVAKNASETYRNHQIITLPDNLLPQAFGSTFSYLKNTIATHIGSFVFIANNKEQLNVIIDAYENKNNWSALPQSKEMLSQFAAVGNYFCYANVPRCNYLLQGKANPGASKWLTTNKATTALFDAFAFCIKPSNNQLETTAYLHTLNKPTSQANVLWSQTLEAPALFAPQLVMANDSITYIAIQDTLNQLYLIDNTGLLKWKQTLPEKITGNIHTIDAYKNGSRYLVFATAQKWYLLDLKGMPVSNFPIKLPAATNVGLSIFDLDLTGDFRIYIPCTNGIVYGYNTNGKPLNNFNAAYSAHILQPLQYIGVNQKLLLGFTNNQHVVGFERNGKIALDIALPAAVHTPCVVNNLPNGFQFIDSVGTEISIDSTGNMVPLTVDYSVSFNLKQNESTTIQFKIFNNYCTAELNNKTLFNYNFSESVAPQLGIGLEGNQPVYLLQNYNQSKTYALHANGKLINGFPVAGMYKSHITDLNGDQQLRLVLLTAANVLSVYSLK